MRCNLCYEKKLEVFLDLGSQPMANKYPKKEEFDTEEFSNVKVLFCPDCKNMQLDTLISRETMFEDYYYLSSVNASLVKHYEAFAHSLRGSKFVVDVGSNDGISLKPLKEIGVRALGVEPSINVSKIANDAGYETMTAFLDKESVAAIVKDYGKADVVTGLSMFSHLQDPHQFIEDIKDLMTDDGRLIVEVEYNVAILKKMAFERFYLDRIFYFSVTSFEKLFKLHDMYVSNVDITTAHGGSLRVTAQKKGYGKEASPNVKAIIEFESKELTSSQVESFGKEANTHIVNLMKLLQQYKNEGLKVAGYGCPARVSTITNFGTIGPDLISFIVDDSPLKQGRYSPGRHIPIVTNDFLKKNRPDILIIFAYDYFEQIRKKLKGDYRYVLPVPPREVKPK